VSVPVVPHKLDDTEDMTERDGKAKEKVGKNSKGEKTHTHTPRVLYAKDAKGEPGKESPTLYCVVSEHSPLGGLDEYLPHYLRTHPEGMLSRDLKVISLTLLDTLQHCHRAGICHRDIRPSNILVTRCMHPYQQDCFHGDLVVKLTDFSLTGLVPKTVVGVTGIDQPGYPYGANSPTAGGSQKQKTPPVTDRKAQAIAAAKAAVAAASALGAKIDIRVEDFQSVAHAEEVGRKQPTRDVCLAPEMFAGADALALAYNGSKPNKGHKNAKGAAYKTHLVKPTQLALQQADIWALGCTLYYTASGGNFPFESQVVARQCSGFYADNVPALVDSNTRRMECLTLHNMHKLHPGLFDLVERMLRPVPAVVQHVMSLATSKGLTTVQPYSHTKVPSSHPMAPVMKARPYVADLRCHPFLWSLADRRLLLLKFADSAGRPVPGFENATRGFVSNLDRYASKYVFGTDVSPEKQQLMLQAKKDGKTKGGNAKEGSLDDRVVVAGDWISKFPPNMLVWVPDTLRSKDVAHSAKGLMAVCKYILSAPEMGGLHQAVFPKQSAAQAIVSFLVAMEKIFPRLFILFYELGLHFGKWSHDGTRVHHAWLPNSQMQGQVHQGQQSQQSQQSQQDQQGNKGNNGNTGKQK